MIRILTECVQGDFAVDRTISTIVIDDEALVAVAIGYLAGRIGGVEILGVAMTGWDGMALIEKFQPKVALVDPQMPDLSGIDLITCVVRKKLPTRVVFLTGSSDGELCRRARKAGAVGYLLKASLEEELGIAIRAAADGKPYVTPAMMQHFWNESPKNGEFRLTLRQREILQLIVHDKTNKEIASILNIEVRTVEKHRAELKRRFDVNGTGGLVWNAIRLGVVQLPDLDCRKAC
jgi:two-component system, LuxR family, secretion system response regulator SsrB